MSVRWLLKSRLRFEIATMACLALLTSPVSAFGIEPSYVSTDDPSFPTPPLPDANSARRLELWLQALSRPERLLKIKAAEAISLEAERGNVAMKAAIPALQAELNPNKQSDPLVRFACARSLIQLDSRESADLIMRHVLKDGQLLSEFAEPALAKWKHAPMQDVWLSRLNDPKLPPRALLRAIQGVSVSDEKRSIPRLKVITRERNESLAIRLAAALALSTLQTQGLEEDASKLLEQSTDEFPSEALLAVTLLSHHDGDSATRILVRLVEHNEAAVISMALRRLAEIAPRSIEHLNSQLNSQLLVHNDPNVRE
ncbi:MAG: hypothetical protein FJ267_03715, partial [Planctomycetes bacterium]|nr:hypothetical protein [Planctomycetota bacterium]